MQGSIAALEDLHHCSTDVRVAVTGTITEIQTVGLTAVDFHKYSTSKIPQQMALLFRVLVSHSFPMQI